MMRPVFMLNMEKIGQDEFNARRTMRVPKEWRGDYPEFMSCMLGTLMRCVAEYCVSMCSVDAEARKAYDLLCERGRDCLEEAIRERLRAEMEERECD